MPVAGRELPDLTESTFSPDRTALVAVEACRQTSLDPTGMVLLRHQTNAVYRLVTAPVIVKVVRPGIRHTDDIVKLVRWLTEQQVPTVPLLDIGLPMHVAGCAVTLWRHLPQDREITADQIAGPLRSLHDIPMVPLTLPRLDALGAIRHSIEVSTIVSDIERAVLEEFLDDVAARLRPVEASVPRLIHGDPQHRNTLWDTKFGAAVLCDWESAVIGPVEWDLVTVEVHCRRFGFSSREYGAFCDRYGRDVRQWVGYEVYRDLRELRMITTNARKSLRGTPQAAEVRRRISGLGGDVNSPWNIL